MYTISIEYLVDDNNLTEQQVRELANSLFRIRKSSNVNVNNTNLIAINCSYNVPINGFKKRKIP